MGRQSIRFLFFALFVALLAEAAAAQSVPGTTGIAVAQQQSRSATACSELSDPRAVNADVNLCVDRLVKADVQDVPGARVDRNVSLYNDPELLSPPQENLFAPRPKVPGISSRGPQPGFTSWGPRQTNVEVPQPEPDEPAPEATLPPTVQSPEAPLLTDTAATRDQPLPEAESGSELQWKLKRARAQKAEEDRRREVREQQKRFDAQCRQLHLSDLECRLKLKSDPLMAITGRMNKLEKALPQETH